MLPIDELKRLITEITDLTDAQIIKKLLGISPDTATVSEIQAAWRKSARIYHPDKQEQDNDEATALNQQIFVRLDSACKNIIRRKEQAASHQNTKETPFGTHTDQAQAHANAAHRTGFATEHDSKPYADWQGDTLDWEIYNLPQNPIRTKLLESLAGAHFLIHQGITLKELLSLDLVWLNLVLEHPDGTDSIAHLRKENLSFTDIMGLHPKVLSYILSNRRGDGLAQLIHSGMGFHDLKEIDPLMLTGLIEHADAVCYLHETQNLPLNTIVNLKKRVLVSLVRSIGSVEEMKLYNKYKETGRGRFRSFHIRESSIRIQDILNLPATDMQDLLLLNLDDVGRLIDIGHVTLDELSTLDTQYLNTLFKKLNGQDKVSTVIGLIDECSMPFLTIIQLGNVLFDEILPLNNMYIQLISEANIPLKTILALPPQTKIFLNKYLKATLECLKHKSLDEILNMDEQIRSTLFHDISTIYDDISLANNFTYQYVLASSAGGKKEREVRCELMEQLSNLLPFKSDLKNLIVFLTTLEKTDREKIYVHWNIIDKLINVEHIPWTKLQVLANMNDSAIRQISSAEQLPSLPPQEQQSSERLQQTPPETPELIRLKLNKFIEENHWDEVNQVLARFIKDPSYTEILTNVLKTLLSTHHLTQVQSIFHTKDIPLTVIDSLALSMLEHWNSIKEQAEKEMFFSLVITASPAVIAMTLSHKHLFKTTGEKQAIQTIIQCHKLYDHMPSPLEGAKKILEDYTKKNSAITRFFHGHWNRHHVTEVNQIVNNIGVTITSIQNLLTELKKIPLKNSLGTLARRIQFLETRNRYVPDSEPAMHQHSRNA